jgi:hypothetical protein
MKSFYGACPIWINPGPNCSERVENAQESGYCLVVATCMGGTGAGGRTSESGKALGYSS